MEDGQRKVLRSLVLMLRHELEGHYEGDRWVPGDLEGRLAELGVRKDLAPRPIDELSGVTAADRRAREVVDAYLELRRQAGVSYEAAVREYVREAAYCWANRLLALRCMEARGLLEAEAVLQKEAYGWRSLVHHRLLQRDPGKSAGEDEGLFDALEGAFAERAESLPRLFQPTAPGIALRPSAASLGRCVGLLSGRLPVRGQGTLGAKDEVFRAADALGWAYQYWNAEENKRVFAAARKQGQRKAKKIEGADIIPATQLYTEPYMVKFLVQNSLGALWLGMHPDSGLAASFAYYVRDADRPPVAPKPIREIRMLDPACGSGHFLLEAFDLFYAMYEEEGTVQGEEAICRSILAHNLHGIDIDERAVQIAEAVLWMKAAERTFSFRSAPMSLAATNLRLPQGKDHLRAFLARHPEDQPLEAALQEVFDGLQHADELGSLLRIEEPVAHALEAIQREQEKEAARLFGQQQTGFSFDQPRQMTMGDSAAWKERTLRSLHAHFQEEARSTDLLQSLFGQTAERGLSLFELLSARYDVVVANPPYMGSKNMGPVVRGYVEKNYEPGRRDLYAAFILRCLGLCNDGGRVALVTPQLWMFTRSYAELRSRKDAGLLRSSTIETLAQLGRHAFEEADPPSNVALCVFRAVQPESDHRIRAFRLSAPAEAQQQAAMLRTALNDGASQIRSYPLQARFLEIPLAPLCYWLRERFLDLLTGPRLGKVAEVRQGTATAADQRFVRFVWESPATGRWVPFEKGGGYGKWFGHQWWMVDWEKDGIRIQLFPKSVVRNEKFYDQCGWTYSLIARGAMGVRQYVPPAALGHKGPGIFLSDSGLAATLNTHLFSFFIRAASPSLSFEVDTVSRAPLPHGVSGSLCEICTKCKAAIVACDPTERSFSAPGAAHGTAVHLHSLEGWLERLVMDGYSLNSGDVAAVLDETGTPAGWLPLLAGHEDLPPLPLDVPSLPEGLGVFLASLDRLSEANAMALRGRLRQLYEAGPGAKAALEEASPTDGEDDLDEGGDDDDTVIVGARIIIPTETFLEELSQKLGLHPISVYCLLQRGIAEEGWRCLPEERRLYADRVTVLVLQLLGHRWPRQFEAGEAPPAWADDDGIIPLTDGTAEETLLQRVRARLAAEVPDGDVNRWERDFAQVMGRPLGEWLEVEFFGHHASQFKRRPVAWQLQSGRYTKKTRPAFACLVYYHRLDGDLLQKIRTQYVGPLRERMGTELRGLEALSPDDRNERQARRLDELREGREQLRAFDEALERVSAAGFQTGGLPGRAAIDCLQSLTRGVLCALRRRLGDAVAGETLLRWTAAATDMERDLSADVDRYRHQAGGLGALSDLAPPGLIPDLPGRMMAAIQAAIQALPADFLRFVPTPPEGAPDVAACRGAVIARLPALVKHAADELCAALCREFDRTPLHIPRGALRKSPAKGRIKELLEDVGTLCLSQEAGLAEDVPALPSLDEPCRPAPGTPAPPDIEALCRQEASYRPDRNDGVRVNVAPLQGAGLLPSPVLAPGDVAVAIADRAAWRADERRWCRQEKLPHPGWWEAESSHRALRDPMLAACEAVLGLLREGGGVCDDLDLRTAYALLATPDRARDLAPPELRSQLGGWRAQRTDEVRAQLVSLAIEQLASRSALHRSDSIGRKQLVLTDAGRAAAATLDQEILKDARIALAIADSMRLVDPEAAGAASTIASVAGKVVAR